ncbi:uncharacterized protein VTP21DRAFT_5678 [Calcarisporiella thermophila]|uniref:uncharacterized protein n=1 Tax=Calcarisporiella thermophila TaxID=911321 RepID=UPI0037439BAF
MSQRRRRNNNALNQRLWRREGQTSSSGGEADVSSEIDDTPTPTSSRSKITAYRPPYCPSFTIAFKLILVARLIAALTTSISDCDEVFNYWEPTHYLQYGYGMQTWEYSPVYAIRSWAYAGLHALVGMLVSLLTKNKVQTFYLLRLAFATLCAYCETVFYRSVVTELNPHIGRYVLTALIVSAGMFQAATAFLPSTFSMYTTMLAFAHCLRPPSDISGSRTYRAIFWFGVGALLGWPFSAAVGIPFVFEELLMVGKTHPTSPTSQRKKPSTIDWRVRRVVRFTIAVLAGLLVLLPIILVDYIFYKKIAIVPLNIVLYNVFGGANRGPDIFGTEPWYFYILNGLLNFNILSLLSLASIPILLVSRFLDPNCLVISSGTANPTTLLTLKLLPLYIWMGIFTLQSHKEERFLFVVYPLICLNAAVALFLLRGLLQRVAGKLNISSYRLLSTFTASILLLSAVLSISRIVSLYSHYHAPLEVYEHFSLKEWPAFVQRNMTTQNEEVNVCVGKEWYRFPSHYFLPHGTRLRFLRSEFRGLLPAYFAEGESRRDGTSRLPQWKMNDVNREEMDRYVPVEECTYLVDFDTGVETKLEPRYVNDANWERVICKPFLDASRTPRLSRAFYLPFNSRTKKWGDYCLLRRQTRG